jgi:hypothetical protein
MFGKGASDYLRFQRAVLVALVVVGLARIVLSVMGVPSSVVRWFSLNLVAFPAAFYYGWATWRRGFGSYRQVLGLAFFRALVFHGVAILGILLAIAGFPNLFAAPEFGGGPDTNQWLHIAAHLAVGIPATSLIWWALGSIALAVTRRRSARPAAASA